MNTPSLRRTLRAAASCGAFVLLLAPCSADAAPGAKEPPPNARLAAVFERQFQDEIKGDPELATFLGIEGANDRLADRSPAATKARKALARAREREIAAFDPARLNAQDRISRAMALERLREQIAFDALYGDLPFGAHGLDGWLVVSPIQGVQDHFAFLAKATPTRNVRDYEDYLKRLAAIPAALGQLTARMKAAAAAGWMPPRATLGTVPSQIAAFATGDPAESPLYGPFRQFPAGLSDAERERLSAAGRRAIAETVQPAFAAFQRYVEAEYIPASRPTLAATELPSGAKYYALEIASSTTTTLTAKEIHDTGLAEVARIRKAMEGVIASTGFKGSFTQFQEFLRTDPRFYYTKPEDMLLAYRDMAKRADAELPRFFAELPRLTYGIRAMEPHEGDNAEHYTRGALDGSRAGYFEANTNNLAKHPRYDMESILLHEAVPGHHLQIARSQELKGLPTFRRASGYVAYSEGWALYAESLGYEMGFYQDPYTRFGTLSNEMLRACRLVLDTGLHAFGWSRERAIDYLLDNTGMHREAATAEIDRYIVWPGQALGYKIGELRIKALRAKATAALGDRFDLRRFHNAILDDGGLPLGVLETRIDEWIAKERARR
jgi:uncharacterized protein (DUF885 family)